MTVLKSTDVYRIAREILKPWCRAEGFKRLGSGVLTYGRPHPPNHLLFWLQCSQSAWDTYAGGQFILEVQFSRSPCTGAYGPDCRRERLPHFLSPEELDRLRVIQNQVIAVLPTPPRAYTALFSDDVSQWYQRRFLPVSGPYRTTDDIWLRYLLAEHVEAWAHFILGVLPRIASAPPKPSAV